MATAYAALVSVLNTLDLIQNHPRHSFSFENKQIESLLEIVNFLINFMETGDYHGGRSGAAEALEKRISFAAHAAQDLIDSHVEDQIRSGYTRSGKSRVSRFLLDLQKAIENMEFVRRKAIMLQKVQSGFKVEHPTYSSSAASPSKPPTSQENTMVGFDGVLHKLLDLLTGEAADRRIIPIVGMGGLGKTTLARHAFQHKCTVEYFDVCLWATISQQYDVIGILKQLLSSRSSNPSTGTIDELGHMLYKSLFGRRYLIVLDDMWSSKVWYEMRFYFPEDKDNRSRIIVTTRQSDVAHHLTSSPSFPVNLLDEDTSWDLFCEKVFGDQEGCPPELKEVGYKIVEKCRGLPLAIVVLGGHLRNSSQTLEYWEKVAKDIDSVLSSGENESCLDILSLSYSYLPVYLKPCFLYMGSFEEDKRVNTATLIKLWIGEGFVKSSKTHNLEEVAEGYLNYLVDRNLLLVSWRNSNGKIERCQIHDIVRELCLKIVEKENFLCVLDTPQVGHRERRVVSHENKSKQLDEFPYYKRSPFICSRRVLSGVDVNFLEFGGDRLNLQYLRFFMPTERLKSQYISPSISLLWSLQTLIISGSYNTVVAPYEIWEMLQLRHVETTKILLPDPFPSDLDQTNLQTLSDVRNLRLSEEVCKKISHIKKLSISYFGYSGELEYDSEFDEARSHYCLHNLSRLQKLESLKCWFSYGLNWPGFSQSLLFPNSLKKLVLNNSRLYWDELSHMAGLLPLLQSLELTFSAIIGSQCDTIEGHFDNLKSLTISYCPDLVHFNAENSHLPALRDLVLRDLKKLDELPSSIGDLPSLHRIVLMSCSVSLAMSAMRILVEQQDNGNENLHLHVNFALEDADRESFQNQMQEEGLNSNNLTMY